MKIYIVTGVSFPYGMASTNRIKCYAKAIESQGVTCEIVLYLQKDFHSSEREGVFEGMHYKYVGNKMSNLSGISKRLAYIKDELKLLSYLNRVLQEGDVVISYGATVGFTPLLVKITHHKKAKFVLELVELPYGTSTETDETIRKRAKLVKQFKTYDGVIAISEALSNYAKQYTSKTAKFITIPILVEYDKYNILDKSDAANVPYIFHSGSLFEQKDGFVGMLEAFGKACLKSGNEMMFISTGAIDKSPHKDQIRQVIEKYKISDKVKFTGYLQESELQDYLSHASIVIINKYRTQQNVYCFSTKLGEYMAAGKYVIITKVGEATRWLEDGVDCRMIETEDNDALCEAIIEGFNNKEMRLKLSMEAKRSCQRKFDYHNYGKTMIVYFNSLKNNYLKTCP